MGKRENMLSLLLAVMLLPGCTHQHINHASKPIFMTEHDLDECLADTKLPPLSTKLCDELEEDEEIIEYEDEDYYWDERGGDYKKSESIPLSA